MNPFWILGAVGVAFLLELYCLDSASKRGYQRGFEEGVNRGKLDGGRWWMEQEMEVLAEREKIWREE